MAGKVTRLCIALVTGMLITGCSSSGEEFQPVPEDLQAIAPIPSASGLVVVKMNPAIPVSDPFAATGLSKLVSTPQVLSQLLPPNRLASFDDADLVVDGVAFNSLLPFNRVYADPLEPTTAVFAPTWSGENTSIDDAAYALYRFPLMDYSISTREQTIGLDWADNPPDPADLWIGIGNRDRDAWDWFNGEPDNVLTLDSYAPYEAEDGDVVFLLVMLGEVEVKLSSLQVGALELRGTGDEPAEFTPLPEFPQMLLAPDLFVDLSSDCSPINDQGSISSCTAFAAADGALNYELGQLYESCGWDFTDPFNLVSPRFVYNQTGVDQGGTCPGGGRNTSDVGTWLLVNGAATEFNAPYGSTNGNLYNCGTGWSAAATTDAALLKPKVKAFIGSKHPITDNWYLDDGRIESVKTILDTVRKPVVFRSNLDSGFSGVDYENGGSWTYSGPKTGGHAMLVVGYDDDRNGGSFKVRNSWGVNWGDDGYCWITYNSFKSSTAGVYCYYLIAVYDPDVVDRFCPSPPIFLPPLGLAVPQFYPDRIRIDWDPVPGALRYLIFRDNQEQSFGYATAGSPMFEDVFVDDYMTHVYWVKAVGDDQISDYSAPLFAWRIKPPQ